MVRVIRQKRLERNNHGGEAALHVSRTTPIEAAAPDDGFEWVRVPLVRRSGGHHVSMAGKTQDRSAVTTASPEIGHISKLHRFAVESEWLQAASQKLLATRVIRSHRR